MAKYSWILASSQTHEVVTSIAKLKEDANGYGVSMGFFLDGKAIGKGEFIVMNRSKTEVATDYVKLLRGFRCKGHGLHLYLALIDCAKSLGATRIYSSTALNKHSTRMWNTKLKRYGFDVKRTAPQCKSACKHCKLEMRYYIDLR